MGTYEKVLVVVFFLLTAVFARNGIRSYRRAGAEREKGPRKAIRRKALLWMALGLLFFLTALYILLRVSWILLIVVAIGNMAVAYVIGTGVAANLRER